MDSKEFVFAASELGKVLKYDVNSHQESADLGKIMTADISAKVKPQVKGGIMSGSIYSIDISKTGQQLAVSDNEGNIKLFNPKTGNCITQFANAHDEQSIDVVKFDNQGRDLYSAGAEGKLKKWCMKTKRIAQDFGDAHRGATIMSLAFADDFMFSADGVGCIKVWSVTCHNADHKVGVTDAVVALRSLYAFLDMGPSHPRGIQAMKVSGDQKWLFTADDGGYLKMWNIQNIKKAVAPLEHNFGNVMGSGVSVILIDALNTNLWIPNECGVVKKFGIETKKMVEKFNIMDGTTICSGAINQAGNKVWWTNNEGKMICWCPNTGNVLHEYGKIMNSAIHSIAFFKE